MSTGMKTYEGSCHCGHVKYKVDLDLTSDSPQNLDKCNCSICHKTNALLITPKDVASLKIVSPKDGYDGMKDYTRPIPSKDIHHYFCPVCGVQCITNGSYEWKGRKVDVNRVYVCTLDEAEDGSGFDLRKLQTKYWEGRSDKWTGESSETPYPGGVF